MKEIPPQMHDFIFSQVYSQPVFAQDIIYLANRYGAHHLNESPSSETILKGNASSKNDEPAKDDSAFKGNIPQWPVGLSRFRW